MSRRYWATVHDRMSNPSWSASRRRYLSGLHCRIQRAIGHFLTAEGNDVLGSNGTAAESPDNHRSIHGTAHKVVICKPPAWAPLEPPEAYKAVPRRVLGLDGQMQARADAGLFKSRFPW